MAGSCMSNACVKHREGPPLLLVHCAGVFSGFPWPTARGLGLVATRGPITGAAVRILLPMNSLGPFALGPLRQIVATPKTAMVGPWYGTARELPTGPPESISSPLPTGKFSNCWLSFFKSAHPRCLFPQLPNLRRISPCL
jgi:hypothetical protein